MSLRRFLFLWCLALPCMFLLTACDDDEFDHKPPEGQGTLVVDNRTGERINVYVDGTRMNSVRSGRYNYYDLDPGVYRVAVDGRDSRRSFADDADILEGRRTVVDVSAAAYDYRRFDVLIYFD